MFVRTRHPCWFSLADGRKDSLFPGEELALVWLCQDSMEEQGGKELRAGAVPSVFFCTPTPVLATIRPGTLETGVGREG